LPENSSRSGREFPTELNADPRSGLAAFSRPPSVPPCGFASGFPPSRLAAFRRGSAFLDLESIFAEVAAELLFPGNENRSEFIPFVLETAPPNNGKPAEVARAVDVEKILLELEKEGELPDNPEVDEPLKIEAKDSDPYVGADAAAATAVLKDDSGLLSNLKSNFGLVVSTSVDPLVEKEKTGPLLGLAEPKL